MGSTQGLPQGWFLGLLLMVLGDRGVQKMDSSFTHTQHAPPTVSPQLSCSAAVVFTRPGSSVSRFLCPEIDEDPGTTHSLLSSSRVMPGTKSMVLYQGPMPAKTQPLGQHLP